MKRCANTSIIAVALMCISLYESFSEVSDFTRIFTDKISRQPSEVGDGDLKILWLLSCRLQQQWQDKDQELEVLRQKRCGHCSEVELRYLRGAQSPPHGGETLEMVWIKMPPGYLPLEVFQACPTGRTLLGRAWTQRRH